MILVSGVYSVIKGLFLPCVKLFWFYEVWVLKKGFDLVKRKYLFKNSTEVIKLKRDVFSKGDVYFTIYVIRLVASLNWIFISFWNM